MTIASFAPLLQNTQRAAELRTLALRGIASALSEIPAGNSIMLALLGRSQEDSQKWSLRLHSVHEEEDPERPEDSDLSEEIDEILELSVTMDLKLKSVQHGDEEVRLLGAFSTATTPEGKYQILGMFVDRHGLVFSGNGQKQQSGIWSSATLLVDCLTLDLDEETIDARGDEQSWPSYLNLLNERALRG